MTLQQLRTLGLVVTLDGERFTVKPAHRLTEDLVAAIRTHRDAILDELRAEDWAAREEALAKLPPFVWGQPVEEQRIWLARFPDGSYLALQEEEYQCLRDGFALGTAGGNVPSGSVSSRSTVSTLPGSVSCGNLFRPHTSSEP